MSKSLVITLEKGDELIIQGGYCKLVNSEYTNVATLRIYEDLVYGNREWLELCDELELGISFRNQKRQEVELWQFTWVMADSCEIHKGDYFELTGVIESRGRFSFYDQCLIDGHQMVNKIAPFYPFDWSTLGSEQKLGYLKALFQTGTSPTHLPTRKLVQIDGSQIKHSLDVDYYLAAELFGSEVFLSAGLSSLEDRLIDLTEEIVIIKTRLSSLQLMIYGSRSAEQILNNIARY